MKVSDNPQYAVVDVAGSGDNTIVTADSKYKIKVVSYVLVADAAVAVRWKRGSTSISGAMSLAANGGVSASSGHWHSLMETGKNEALVLNLSGAVGVRGHVTYYIED